MSEARASLRLCPLCGFEFDAGDTLCQHGCPLRSHCGLIRCPGCGYEFAERPRGILARLRRAFGLGPSAVGDDEACGLVPLSRVPPGLPVEVAALRGGERRGPLAVFGVLPGAELRVVQQRPACVVRVEETELALEPAIAADILVRRPVDAVA